MQIAQNFSHSYTQNEISTHGKIIWNYINLYDQILILFNNYHNTILVKVNSNDPQKKCVSDLTKIYESRVTVQKVKLPTDGNFEPNCSKIVFKCEDL